LETVAIVTNPWLVAIIADEKCKKFMAIKAERRHLWL
jgi:hypothetical protein